MSLTDKLVIIKKKGGDGMTVPLDTKDRVLFGRSAEANIRIQKKAISSEHTEIVWDKQGLPMLRNLSKTNATLLNGENLTRAVHLHDGDLITIVDRSFRFKSERAVPAERTPLVERKRNVVKNTPKGSALKQSATPKAKQNDENEQVAKQLNFNGKRKSSGSSKKPKMKQPVTYNKLNTPLKHSIVEKATARTSIVPDKALQTPMKNEIVAKGSKAKPAYAAKKMLETPMRNEIKKNGGKAKPAYADKKSLQTPVKKAIREKGSKAKPMYAEKKALDSPMQREIQANGGKAKPMYAEKKALDSPMKSEIKRKGAAEKPMYADKKSLQTPMKKAIRQKGSKAGAAYQYVDNKMATPVKRELTAKAQAIEEKIAAKKAEEAAKQAEQEEEVVEEEEEEEEEVVEEEEEVVEEEQQDDDDKTIDEEEEDDESDEESSDDEIMFNLPTHKTPVKQETTRRLGTPMRDALVARATQPRPAYLREHTLASPLRSSIVNKSSTVVEMHRSRFGGLPTPVKKAIGPAAFDFASRAMALASAKAAASAAVVNESVDEAVDADVSVENDAAVETPVTMLSVDISAAKQDMEQVLEDIEGKMGARGYTKAKMEADMKSLIASVREVFDKLTIAETTVDEDVEEKIAAIEQVEEQVAEEAEEQAQVEEQVEQQEEVKEEAEEEEKEEEKPAPKRRARGRKSVAAVVEPEVVEEVKEEEVEEKVEVKTTRRGRRASTRKSIAVEEPVEEEEEEQVEEEVEKVEEKVEEEEQIEEEEEEEVKPKRATRGRRSTAAAADVVAPSTRRRSTRSRK